MKKPKPILTISLILLAMAVVGVGVFWSFYGLAIYVIKVTSAPVLFWFGWVAACVYQMVSAAAFQRLKDEA